MLQLCKLGKKDSVPATNNEKEKVSHVIPKIRFQSNFYRQNCIQKCRIDVLEHVCFGYLETRTR